MQLRALARAEEEIAKAHEALNTREWKRRQEALQARRRAENLLPCIHDPDARVHILCKLAEIAFLMQYRSEAHEFMGRAEQVSGTSQESANRITSVHAWFLANPL